MTIAVGDPIPDVPLNIMRDGKPATVSSRELFAGRRVVLFALPGAFTPTCSAAHLPGFVVHADDIKGRGIDAIVCLSVNDAYVMNAWGTAQNVDDRIVMVADGSAAFTRAVGLELDLDSRGMGMRSQRYALIADDGVVTHRFVEEPGKFEVSSAESIMTALDKSAA
jgi:peroxiredoxin